MTDSTLRVFYTARTSLFVPFTSAAEEVLIGADYLLTGESDGLACDFTRDDGTGYVSVKDTGTPANDLSNVIGDLFWANAGTSPKLVRNSSGTLQWSPHNFGQRSEELGSSPWVNNLLTLTNNTGDVTDPLGGSTATKLVNAGGGDALLIQSVASVNDLGRAWTFSFWARTASGTATVPILGDDEHGNFWVDPSSVTASVTSAWTLFSFSGTQPADFPNVRWGFGGFGSWTAAGTVYIWGAQLNYGLTATSYLATTSAARYGLAIDYDGTNYGLLTEPAATNVSLQSQAFDVDGSGSPWTNSHTTVTANATTAPDGTTTADKVIPGTGLDTKALLQSQAVTIGVNTVSFYAKPAGYNFVAFRESSTFGSYATFDISNGTVIESGSGGTGAITSVGNGWYRVSMTYTSGGTPETMAYFVMDNSYVSGGPAGYTYTGDGSSGVYFWQAQTEVGTVATSPVPSFAATVTRAKDNVRILPITSIPFSATEGAVYAQYTPIAAGAAFDPPWTIAKDANNLIQVYGLGPNFFVYDGAATQCDINLTGSLSYGTSGQVSAAWKANDFAGSLNGAAVNTDVSGTIPTILSGTEFFALGRDESANCTNVRIYKVVYVPRRVIDADLPTWRYNF